MNRGSCGLLAQRNGQNRWTAAVNGRSLPRFEKPPTRIGNEVKCFLTETAQGDVLHFRPGGCEFLNGIKRAIGLKIDRQYPGGTDSVLHRNQARTRSHQTINADERVAGGGGQGTVKPTGGNQAATRADTRRRTATTGAGLRSDTLIRNGRRGR